MKVREKFALIVLFAFTKHPKKRMWLLFLAVECSLLLHFALRSSLSFFYHLSWRKGREKLCSCFFSFAFTEHPKKRMWLLFLALVSNSSYSNDLSFIRIYKLPISPLLSTVAGSSVSLYLIMKVVPFVLGWQGDWRYLCPFTMFWQFLSHEKFTLWKIFSLKMWQPEAECLT